MSVSTGPWRPIIFFILFSLFNPITALPAQKPGLSSSSHNSPLIPVLGSPPKHHISRRQDGTESIEPRLNLDFPDPCLVQDSEGRWLSFATSGNGHHIQIAITEDPFGEWTHLDQDALPGVGWTSGHNYWAPDVRRLGDDSYIMYFSGELPEGGHCIGAARSKNSTGPYEMDPEPIICPREEGGAIDPAGFFDEPTGRRYIVYKVDGNALNSEAPTPLLLQRVSVDDGTTLIGKPVTIMNRISEQDGPLVEAPNLVRVADGRYLLFFSSNWYTNENYDVKYAVSDNIDGPYIRGAAPFLKTPALGLSGPGGGTSAENGGFMVFHARCEPTTRCMYVIGYGLL
ncbi:hypothetical protein FALBO_3216 [Fusarium albosuccineum]|uniref:Uncharacterized protein n=1 Tax=Fusarium albosuccineum TaxID=1237068 RepID=A0A8H4LKK9_9HYPO|nr:hypothetical protein FALBO_3216 [Fusarium albosuccineum]